MQEGLNTLQLREALTREAVTKPFFRGVYAADQVRGAQVTPPCLMIVNTDPQEAPGSHWLLFFFVSDHLVEMFDSLGKSVDHYSKFLTQWIRQQAQQMDVMTQRVQPEDSALCGHYCLYYAYYRCTGETMRDIAQHIPPPTWIETWIPLLFDIHPILSTECQHCITL